ncbi:RNA polymerase sigma factor sigD, chloroplastic-like [Coffea eugenioides]|uniref:RNA polymerase sigma factor sigD, chloroplastic-like n=1 Tax=Coffea eugenioides TaxID=49369 RepID=UPI000F6083A2|nr:RNA polymerase sigma factor sigD, chloroplastic-like [Coffea eugenioides]
MAVSGEEARVETVRKRIEETTENEVTLAQWAKAICTIILNAESAAYTSTFPKFIMGSVSELVPRICEANAILSRRLWKLPTCQEIAEAVKRDILTVELALERNREPISLDQPIVAGASISLQEIVAGPDETTPEAMLKKQFMKRDIEKLLNHSTRKEDT